MNVRTLVSSLSIVLFCTVSAAAQLIEVKTYPILSGDGPLFTPSSNASMGGVSIAFRDELAEPFENPASLVSGPGDILFTAPGWSSWRDGSEETHGWKQGESQWNGTSTTTRSRASTFSAPAGGIWRVGDLTIGVVGEYQRVASGFYQHRTSTTDSPSTVDASLGSNNWSGRLSAGLPLPCLGISIGASAAYVDLRGISGHQFLYPDVKSLSAAGSIVDLRLGLEGTFAATHHVSLAVGRNVLEVNERAEYSDNRAPIENQDRTEAWFAQARYRTRLSERLTIGVSALGNRKEHPKIPEYPIASIPRDPGVTWAFDLGVGASWNIAQMLTFSVEGIVEPISSKTWVEAEEDIVRGTVTIRKGEIEQRNNYTFMNHILRAGLRLETEPWMAILFGGEVHGYSFDYYNRNYLLETETRTSPQRQWNEVTITGGLELRLWDATIEYGARLLTGQGMLEQENWWGWRNGAMRAVSDHLMPPNGMVDVKPLPVVSHRLTVRWSL